jgi:sugar lactone lactonase YvrE
MISTNTINSWFSDVAVDAWGQPHVVWYSGRPTDQGSMDLLMYSTLVGQGWLEPNDIAAPAYGGMTVRPVIAVDNVGTLHVTYRGDTRIYYTNSPVSEAWSASSWAPPTRISGAGAGATYYSDVAVDEQGRIHVVWSESVSAGIDDRWLWFGTPEGVALYDGRGWRSQEPQAGLDDREIYAIIEDDAGVQWFGTDEGVYRFDGAVWRTFTTRDGLVGRQVSCITQDADGRLWFGTDRGVSVYDEEAEWDDSKWTAYTAGAGLPDNTVHAIAADPLGTIWVGTEGGLASYDGQNWVNYTIQDGLVSAEILAIASDARGGVWAGTREGVSQYSERHWTTYTVDSGMLSNVVTAIVVDREGAVWFGTDSGLNRFDGREWTSYTAGEGLGGGAVTALMVDSERTIWVGTEQGVSRYDGLAWETFELPQGFATQKITAIAEDRRVNAICPLCADIFYRHSTDEGKSWSAPFNLSSSFAGSGKPQVRVSSGGKVYVTWEEGEDWYTHEGYPIGSVYAYSPDGGNSWTEPTVFSTLDAPQQITLGVGRGGDLVAVWRPAEEDSPYYYQLSTDNGITWSEPEPIPGVIAKPWATFSLDGYDAATDSAGDVHLLVLGRLSSLEEDLSLLHLVWNGSEWSSPTRIYTSIDPPEWPRIDVGAGNKVYATWFTRDEKHIHDSERGRYKVWVSSFQASAPSQTPIPAPAPTSTLPSAPEQATPIPVMTPELGIAPDSSGLPSGLRTENDEIGQLILALSPAVVVLLAVVVLRLSRFRRRR